MTCATLEGKLGGIVTRHGDTSDIIKINISRLQEQLGATCTSLYTLSPNCADRKRNVDILMVYSNGRWHMIYIWFIMNPFMRIYSLFGHLLKESANGNIPFLAVRPVLPLIISKGALKVLAVLTCIDTYKSGLIPLRRHENPAGGSWNGNKVRQKSSSLPNASCNKLLRYKNIL